MHSRFLLFHLSHHSTCIGFDKTDETLKITTRWEVFNSSPPSRCWFWLISTLVHNYSCSIKMCQCLSLLRKESPQRYVSRIFKRKCHVPTFLCLSHFPWHIFLDLGQPDNRRQLAGGFRFINVTRCLNTFSFFKKSLPRVN